MINDELLAYREAVRHLFNISLLPLIEKIEDFNDQFDIIDDFHEIEANLFKNMVLNRHDIVGKLASPIMSILLRPKFDSAEILIENPKGDNNRYWDYPLTRIAKTDVKLCFIDFYDFDLRSYRDYSFYETQIMACIDERVVGRRALCPISQYEAYLTEQA